MQLKSKIPCPACNYHTVTPFFYDEKQPLATLGWPANEADAVSMELLPLDFVSCLRCGHIFNHSFDYSKVPYQENPNRMFNDSAVWKQYIQDISQKIAALLPENPTVVEIGCGDGSFLKTLKGHVGKGRFLGFDPNGSANSDEQDIEFYKSLFDPDEHVKEFTPDIVICRHVVEHLTTPLELFQPLADNLRTLSKKSYLFIEVPCVDNAVASNRTSDYFYEHFSNFTKHSFTTFINNISNDKIEVETAYTDEVVYGIVELCPRENSFQENAERFVAHQEAMKEQIRNQLSDFESAGKKVAVWGGTGKSAAFMNYHKLAKERFPFVVDSDPLKYDYHVPGMGQLIRPPQFLLSNLVEIILIPTQWRAADILREIKSLSIPYEAVMIEYEGKLIDLENEQNIYYPGNN